MLQTLAIYVNIHITAWPVVTQVENTCHSLGRAGFQTPQLAVFGKIGCQSALYVGESFRLEGTANVINVNKPAAVCDRKVIGVLVEQCRS